ncbi:hypothetical protein KEJ47_02185 [Candidatus Bathyarchaeota archaeon]|nr:hypothetical protein [Candidatus Bathyarchaeota archaeon]
MLSLIIPLFVTMAIFQTFSQTAQEKEVSVPFFLIKELKDPAIALSYGIRGIIEVTSPNTPRYLKVEPGKIIEIPLVLTFISYDHEINSTEVLIDPQNIRDYTMEVGLGEGRFIVMNNYVKYSINGTVILEASKPLSITMTWKIPQGLSQRPQGLPPRKIYISIMGISAKVPIIESMVVCLVV